MKRSELTRHPAAILRAKSYFTASPKFHVAELIPINRKLNEANLRFFHLLAEWNDPFEWKPSFIELRLSRLLMLSSFKKAVSPARYWSRRWRWRSIG